MPIKKNEIVHQKQIKTSLAYDIRETIIFLTKSYLMKNKSTEILSQNLIFLINLQEELNINKIAGFSLQQVNDDIAKKAHTIEHKTMNYNGYSRTHSRIYFDKYLAEKILTEYNRKVKNCRNKEINELTAKRFSDVVERKAYIKWKINWFTFLNERIQNNNSGFSAEKRAVNALEFSKDKINSLYLNNNSTFKKYIKDTKKIISKKSLN